MQFKNVNTLDELLKYAQEEEQIITVDPLDRPTSLLEAIQEVDKQIENFGTTLAPLWEDAQNDEILLQWITPELENYKTLEKYIKSMNQIALQLPKGEVMSQELINLADQFDLVLANIFEAIRVSPEKYEKYIDDKILHGSLRDLHLSLIDDLLPELQETYKAPTEQIEYNGWVIEQGVSANGKPFYSLNQRLNPDKVNLMPKEEYVREDLSIIKRIIDIIEEKQIGEYKKSPKEEETVEKVIKEQPKVNEAEKILNSENIVNIKDELERKAENIITDYLIDLRNKNINISENEIEIKQKVIEGLSKNLIKFLEDLGMPDVINEKEILILAEYFKDNLFDKAVKVTALKESA